MVENNHFANSQNVLVACFSPQPGFWHARGNTYENVAWVADDTCLASANRSVRRPVTPGAGVGKVNCR